MVLVTSLLVLPSSAVAATPFTIKTFSPAGAQLAADQAGNVWFAVQPRHGPADVVRLTPSGQRTRFPIPTAPGEDAPQRTEVITTAPDGTVWFLEGGSLGTITPTGTVTFLSQSRALVDLGGDGVIGTDGNLWFAGGADGGAIGRATPAGEITLFGRGRGVQAMTLGRDGNVWYISGRRRIGRITPAGQARVFALPRRVEEANDTALGPDGNIWFTAYGDDRGYLGKITPSGRVRLYRSGTDSVADLTAGPDRRVWFTGWKRRRGFQHHLIGRITTGGRAQSYLFSDGRRRDAGEIVTGGNGTMWVTRRGTTTAVSRVTLRGR